MKSQRIAILSCTAILFGANLCAEDSKEPSSSLAPPRFRLRTDPYAASDAQALREQLRYLVDAQGPINPAGQFQRRFWNARWCCPGREFLSG